MCSSSRLCFSRSFQRRGRGRRGRERRRSQTAAPCGPQTQRHSDPETVLAGDCGAEGKSLWDSGSEGRHLQFFTLTLRVRLRTSHTVGSNLAQVSKLGRVNAQISRTSLWVFQRHHAGPRLYCTAGGPAYHPLMD